jgi:hypothetical protein
VVFGAGFERWGGVSDIGELCLCDDQSCLRYGWGAEAAVFGRCAVFCGLDGSRDFEYCAVSGLEFGGGERIGIEEIARGEGGL